MRISRRALLFSAAPAVLRARNQRPNILWMMTDEQRPDSMGCYGSPWGHSPNLDELAGQGVVFRSAYVPSPVCVACRSALLAGQAASTTGVLHNESKVRPRNRFLTWRFEEAGYQTATFGKQHYFGGGGRRAFQTEGGTATEGIVQPTRYGSGWKMEDFDVVQYPGRPGQRLYRPWILAGKFPASEDQTAEARNVALAQQWLGGRDATKPFLLRLSLNAPHTPVVAPERYLSLVQPDRIRIPEPTPHQLAAQPERERVVLRNFEGSDVLTPEQLHKIRHYYYARCAFADAMMGRLLDWMRARKLLENTIVVMMSDHGAHLGDQGLLQKQTFYDQVATVPYFFWWPGQLAGGRQLQTPVSVLGLLPTLLELSGLPHEGAEAPSLARSLRDGKEPRKGPVFSEICFGYQGWRDDDRQVMVRDGDWKLTVFAAHNDPARFAESRDGSLFNLRLDPAERRNLIADRAIAPQASRLLRAIEEWDRGRGGPPAG